MDPSALKAKIARLKEELVFVERSLRPKKVRFFERDRLSGRRTLRIRVDPAPSGPYMKQIEAKRFDLLASLKGLEKLLPLKPRLAQIIQERDRPAHPSFGKRAMRRKQTGIRLTLRSGRRSIPADRRDLAALWTKESASEVLKPLLRVAEAGELSESLQVNAKSVLRPLKVEPARPRYHHKVKRKPFWKMFRNFKGTGK